VAAIVIGLWMTEQSKYGRNGGVVADDERRFLLTLAFDPRNRAIRIRVVENHWPDLEQLSKRFCCLLSALEFSRIDCCDAGIFQETG
jgi:hypothetical protein